MQNSADTPQIAKKLLYITGIPKLKNFIKSKPVKAYIAEQTPKIIKFATHI